jgi:hypothetical protein
VQRCSYRKAIIVELKLKEFNRTRYRVCLVLLAVWLVLLIVNIWHYLNKSDVVGFILRSLACVFGLLYVFIMLTKPIRLEIHENGLKVDRTFYSWSDLKLLCENDCLVLRTRECDTISIPLKKLDENTVKTLKLKLSHLQRL